MSREGLRLFVREHKETHDAYENVLEDWIVIQDDSDHAQVAQGPPRAAQDVFPLQPKLSRRVEAAVVHAIVVALRQHLNLSVHLLVNLHHAVHDRDVSVLDLEDDDFASADWVVVVGQEENVSALKGRLHGPTSSQESRRVQAMFIQIAEEDLLPQHDDDWRFRFRHHHQPLPDHQRGEDDHGEVEDLKDKLSLILP
eukprot:scaffold2582_cov162-Ochromonas_danica.AAC.25